MQQSIYYIDPMTRPLRIKFNGALYYITSQGGTDEEIYLEE